MGARAGVLGSVLALAAGMAGAETPWLAPCSHHLETRAGVEAAVAQARLFQIAEAGTELAAEPLGDGGVLSTKPYALDTYGLIWAPKPAARTRAEEITPIHAMISDGQAPLPYAVGAQKIAMAGAPVPERTGNVACVGCLGGDVPKRLAEASGGEQPRRSAAIWTRARVAPVPGIGRRVTSIQNVPHKEVFGFDPVLTHILAVHPVETPQ